MPLWYNKDHPYKILPFSENSNTYVLIMNTYQLKQQFKALKALHRITLKFAYHLMNSKISLVQLSLVCVFLNIVRRFGPTRNQRRSFLVGLGKNC